jgi:hypothetical protein
MDQHSADQQPQDKWRPTNRPATAAECHADSACEKLLNDSAPSIFKVQQGHETGTGWLGPDNRLITDYHVIQGGGEVTAEDDAGHHYRLGKDIAIDDVNDLAAIGFLNGPPKNARPLSLSDKAPETNEIATMLSHRMAHSLELTTGKFLSSSSLMSALYGSEMEKKLPKYSASNDVLDKEKAVYYSRSVENYEIGGGPGSSGAPLFDKDGKVSSVFEISEPEKYQFGTIPASDVAALINRPRASNQFIISTGYENSFQDSWRKYKAESVPASTFDTAVSAAGLYGLSKTAFGQPGKLSVAASALYLTSAISKDSEKLFSSKDWRDVLANGSNIAGDTALLAGTVARFVPRASQASLALLGVGVGLKLAGSLVPNHYAIQGIKRANGDKRPPIFDSVSDEP